MATPTVTANLTTIADCESTTNMVGNKPTLDTEILKQGSNSVNFTMANQTNKDLCGFSMSSTDLSGQHCRMWFTTTTFPNMDTFANGGLQFYLTDGTNTAYWNIAGKDTYFGGWLNICVYADSTPTSGSVNSAAVTGMGVQCSFLSNPRATVNAWMDYLRYGDGLYATGGTAFTATNYIDIEGVYQDDLTNGYGIVEKVEDAYFLSGYLQYGNGATTTYASDENKLIVFTDKTVSSTLYKLDYQGSGCNAQLKGSTVKAAGSQQFDIFANDANLATFTQDGCSIQFANNCQYKNGQTVTNNSYNACDQISVGTTTTFQSNTISNSTDTNGALLWPGTSTNISGLTFINNNNGVQINSTGPFNFSDLTFDDVSGKYDVNNTSGAGQTVSKTNGTNANSYNPGGSAVTFTVSATLTINNLQANSELRVYRASDLTQLGVADPATVVDPDHSGRYKYDFAYTTAEDVIIQIIALNYQVYRTTYTLDGTNQKLPIEQIIDRVYI